MESNILFAFGLTIFAGLSTGIGSAIAFFSKKTNKNFLSVSLGFSAGVMIYVSFVEIFRKSNRSFLEIYSPREAAIWTMAGFFTGILIILIIDKLIPSYENPHTPMSYEQEGGTMFQMKTHYRDEMRLMRMGLFTALAIAIHNFPEGLATFTAAMTNPAIGISISVAIAIHNIPEGIAVSVPIYHATGSKKKAFWYSFFSGVSEPVGAVIGYLLLRNLFNPFTFGFLFSAVAGIMVFISIDELIPTSREYDSGHKSIYGLVSGMAVMGVSLILFM